MTVSPRVTRAALTFLLLGTITALLPSQDTTAIAGNGCFTGPPQGKGKFAVAPSSSNIHDSYTLTAPATNYNFYYQSPASSAYTPVTRSVATTVTVNSGKVSINGNPYTTQYSTVSSTFALGKTAVFKLGVATYELGSATITSIYTVTDEQGNQTTYTARAVVSNP